MGERRTVRLVGEVGKKKPAENKQGAGRHRRTLTAEHFW
jgi:hypothetical protein